MAGVPCSLLDHVDVDPAERRPLLGPTISRPFHRQVIQRCLRGDLPTVRALLPVETQDVFVGLARLYPKVRVWVFFRPGHRTGRLAGQPSPEPAPLDVGEVLDHAKGRPSRRDDHSAVFIDREIRPLEESHRPEIQETGTFEGITDERLKLRKRSAELGFWTLHMPEEVGGGGLSYLGQVLLHEEASLHGLILAHFESIFPVVSGPTPIYVDCTEAQREKYLAPLMSADKVTCFALTEPG